MAKPKIDKLKLYKAYETRIKTRNEKPMNMNEWEKKHRPTGETANEIFVRLAKLRMPKVLNGLKTIKNLSKYEGTKEQKEKMITDIKNAIIDIEISFNAEKRKKGEKGVKKPKPEYNF